MENLFYEIDVLICIQLYNANETKVCTIDFTGLFGFHLFFLIVLVIGQHLDFSAFNINRRSILNIIDKWFLQFIRAGL